MKRKNFIAAILLVLASAAVTPALPEFAIGLGEVEKPSSDASARFNEGLSSFHLMLAALDKKNAEEASKHQAAAVQKVQEAASLYESTIRLADNHVLKPSPKSEQERSEVDYFNAHAEAYGIKPPISQKDLVIASSNLVRKLGMRIKSEEVKALVSDLKRRQSLTNSAAELQAFLVSVTTMLTLG